MNYRKGKHVKEPLRYLKILRFVPYAWGSGESNKFCSPLYWLVKGGLLGRSNQPKNALGLTPNCLRNMVLKALGLL